MAKLITDWFKPMATTCSRNDEKTARTRSSNKILKRKGPFLPVLESLGGLRAKCKLLKLNFNLHVESTPYLLESSDESSEYEVESIIDVRKKNGIQYLVKWKDWPHNYNSWEPAKHLFHSTELILEFHKTQGSTVPKLGIFREEQQTKKKQMSEFIARLLRDDDVASLLKLRGLQASAVLMSRKTLKGIATELKAFVENPPRKTKNHPLILEIMNSSNGLGIDIESFANKRKKTMRTLREWEEELNSIPGLQCSIKVENHVDIEGPPENFTYITDYKAGEGITIPDDPPIGCECDNCYENKNKCCARQSEGTFAYNKYGTLNIPFGRPIFECNKTCKCGPDCVNRVVQKGRQIKLCIFKTDDFRGWGVKTLEKIKKGAYVMEYIGEVITYEEAKNRDGFYDEVGRTYLLDLDYDGDDYPFTVDAAFFGNISHFMNHSCDPNLGIQAVWINNLERKLPRISFFAKRDIKTGEELTFDYKSSRGSESLSGNSRHRSHNDSSSQAVLSEKDIQKELESCPSSPEDTLGGRKRPVCRCGAANCRKYLF